MELQQNLAAIRKQGLGVAAISYDSIGVLKSFADRQHIAYPLLSDADSKIIRAFYILNETAKPGTLTYGIPYPGVYIVDLQGKVVSKYFEDDYNDRHLDRRYSDASIRDAARGGEECQGNGTFDAYDCRQQ